MAGVLPTLVILAQIFLSGNANLEIESDFKYIH